MIPIILVPVVCACGFSGRLPTRASCPSCGESDAHRLNRVRLAALAMVSSAGPDVPVRIAPATRIWLTRNLLIREVEGAVRAAARPRGSVAPEVRATRFRLTEAGTMVLRIGLASLRIAPPDPQPPKETPR